MLVATIYTCDSDYKALNSVSNELHQIITGLCIIFFRTMDEKSCESPTKRRKLESHGQENAKPGIVKQVCSTSYYTVYCTFDEIYLCVTDQSKWKFFLRNRRLCVFILFIILDDKQEKIRKVDTVFTSVICDSSEISRNYILFAKPCKTF